MAESDSVNFKSRGLTAPTLYCPGSGKHYLSMVLLKPVTHGSCPECYQWYPIRPNGNVVAHAQSTSDA